MDGASRNGINNQMKARFSGDNLANFTTCVSELVAAIRNGEEISEKDLQNLKNIVNFPNNLELHRHR